MTIGPIRRRNFLELAVGVVVGDVRGHVAAGSAVLVGSHLQSGVVVVGRVRFFGADDGSLLNERRARIEGVTERPGKDAEPQSVKGDFNAIAHCPRGRRRGMKLLEELPRSFRVRGRKVEEGIPAARCVFPLCSGTTVWPA